MKNTNKLVLTALFAAIIAIMFFTPLGIIPINPVMGATLFHVPVIVGAIVLGGKRGAFLGFLFGFFSMLEATFKPYVVAFAFSPFAAGPAGAAGNPLSLVVAFLPRILIGVVAALVYKLVLKWSRKPVIAAGAAAFLATMTNTVLVLSFIYLFFAQPYAEATGTTVDLLAGAFAAVAGTQGLIEAAIATAVAAAIAPLAEKQRTKLSGDDK